MSNPKVQRRLERIAKESGSDWIGELSVWLGNLEGVVETGIPGKYYARQANGQVITVSNAAKVGPIFDLHVLVRRSRFQPNIWQISEILEDYDVPADGGVLAHHHEQHEEEGSDRLALDIKQIRQFSVRVSDAAGFIVRVYGRIIRTGNTHVKIEHQDVDLSSYTVTAGAQFINIESDESGTLLTSPGEVFEAPEVATAADIPVPEEGHYIIASVLLHEGQTELEDDDIVIPSPVERGGVGAQIFSSIEASEIVDNDYLGFYRSTAGRLRRISFANFKKAFSNTFNQFYGVVLGLLADVISSGDSAGGDLSGTYPNPTVAKVQGLAVKSGMSPSDGDSLIWVAANNRFENGSGSGFVLTIEEVDGSPSVSNVNKVIFPNNSIVDNGDGSVDVDFGATAYPPALRVYMNQNFTF